MTSQKAASSPVLLTVRGTLAHALEEGRKIHNETAGSTAGIANARSLGDLSHHVYAGFEQRNDPKAAKAEVLFVDTWLAAEGIMKFFGGEGVQKASQALFLDKEATVWMQARGGFSYAQPAPMGRDERYLGIVRGPVADPEAAIATFARSAFGGLSAARRRGLLSHSVYVKLAAPNESGPVEVLGVELWCDANGMQEHYSDDEHMAPLGTVFSARPDASIWASAPGHWNEW
jgi:hypothetical protein